MKVVYRGRWSSRTRHPPIDDGDVIELLRSDWDDYGNRTYFETTARIDGRIVELGAIRLMVESEMRTEPVLAAAIDDDWDGEFPLPDMRYVSVPSDIAFYEQISARDLGVARRVARSLRDASLLVHEQDEVALRLVGTPSFRNSLLRERGSEKAYADGWRIFSRERMSVLDLGFRFKDACGDISTLSLSFEPRGPLPTDINVLIGPNGVGKSRILHQMVDDWTSDRRRRGRVGFVRRPNLSQIVVVAYSPFERFPLDMEDKELPDKEIYRYFGLRTHLPNRRGIRLSRNAPEMNAANSLLDCVSDDLRFSAIGSWAKKLETAQQVLRDALDFDDMAVRLSRRRDPAEYAVAAVGDLVVDIEDERYLRIGPDNLSDLCLEAIRADLLSKSGVTFLKDGEPLQLSSGQKLFSFVVLNILGALRRESLVLIDEPELFLHPALEISFIGMLKRILHAFNSKALLSTHSEVVVREVPSACVHVMERTAEEVVISKPPFQTFGGDIQRISSYVFGDNDIRKPFERWIRTKLEEFDGAEALLAALGDDVNEELVVEIRALDALRNRRAAR